jgi:phosphoserine aminotransferase
MPADKPASPEFSSGPCKKRPGYSLQMLPTDCLGRSHRSKIGKVITLTDQYTQHVVMSLLFRTRVAIGSYTRSDSSVDTKVVTSSISRT